LRENSSEGFRKAVHLEILTIELETVTKRLKRVVSNTITGGKGEEYKQLVSR